MKTEKPVFTFSFQGEKGSIHFNAQADTAQEAADSLAKLFEQMMIQLRMQYPKVHEAPKQDNQ